MRAGWELKTIGEVCDVIGGGTPSKGKSHTTYYTGDIRWATVRDMKSDLISDTEFKITREAVKASATNIIPQGNVVIATRVGLGKVCRIEYETAINQDLRGIIPKDVGNLSVPFLFWWMKSVSTDIVKAGKGATVQGVTLPFIKSLQIPMPPLPEQQRIVAILDEAFAGIATAAAHAEKNLSNARALFDSHLQSVLSLRGKGWIDKTMPIRLVHPFYR
ncbi:MAG: restriction endonuclease subunit S [Gallionella sp.]|nr:restriction endonuclease subunit S [Gallionella sp.]